MVLGLGASAVDVVLECDDLPREDGFSRVRRERVVPGGSCANVLAGLARLGTPSALVAQMGDDDYGRVFLEDLEAGGVSAAHVLLKPGGTSLHTFIAVAENGARSILAHMGDSLLALSEDQVAESWLDGVSVFYTDMLPAKPALKLARACARREVPVVFNLQVGPGFMEACGTAREDIEEMISLSRVFVTFRGALEELAGTADPDEALELLVSRHPLPAGAVVTLGQDGARWVHAEGRLEQPAFAVEARDTTGAGDAFSAGLIQSLLVDRAKRPEALAFASACAALKCTMPGPRFTGDRRQVTDLLKERNASS
jgi:sugar/nucleoside kinase (ribokinase family)